MIRKNYPWTHWLSDELLTPEDLNILVSFVDEIQKSKSWGLIHHDSDQIKDKIISDILIRYQEKVLEITSQLSLEHVTDRFSDDSWSTCHLAIQRDGYDYPPHCEHPNKIWSLVTYLHPEKSSGTILMANENDDNPVEVEWLPGRTLIFAGESDVTWHRYFSGESPRSTLCGFIIKGDKDPTR